MAAEECAPGRCSSSAGPPCRSTETSPASSSWSPSGTASTPPSPTGSPVVVAARRIRTSSVRPAVAAPSSPATPPRSSGYGPRVGPICRPPAPAATGRPSPPARAAATAAAASNPRAEPTARDATRSKLAAILLSRSCSFSPGGRQRRQPVIGQGGAHRGSSSPARSPPPRPPAPPPPSPPAPSAGCPGLASSAPSWRGDPLRRSAWPPRGGSGNGTADGGHRARALATALRMILLAIGDDAGDRHRQGPAHLGRSGSPGRGPWPTTGSGPTRFRR